MTAKERLFKSLPKKYHERVKDFHEEGGLIDDCKYIINWKEPWVWEYDYCSAPIRSIKEAVQWTKETHVEGTY